MTSQARRALAAIVARFGYLDVPEYDPDHVRPILQSDILYMLNTARAALAQPDTTDPAPADGPDLLAEAQATHDRAELWRRQAEDLEFEATQHVDVPTIDVLRITGGGLAGPGKFVLVLSSWPTSTSELVRADLAEKTGAATVIVADHPVRLGGGS